MVKTRCKTKGTEFKNPERKCNVKRVRAETPITVMWSGWSAPLFDIWKPDRSVIRLPLWPISHHNRHGPASAPVVLMPVSAFQFLTLLMSECIHIPALCRPAGISADRAAPMCLMPVWYRMLVFISSRCLHCYQQINIKRCF